MLNIKVIEKANHHTVYSTKKISKGENIIELEGIPQSFPSKYSLQIAEKKHLVPFSDSSEDERSFWRFLNHSCQPNSYFDLDKMTLIALREIHAGQEITYNYCTTEYDMASPFKCVCGSDVCYGEIKGFRYLPKAKQQELVGTLAPYLKKYCE